MNSSSLRVAETETSTKRLWSRAAPFSSGDQEVTELVEIAERFRRPYLARTTAQLPQLRSGTAQDARSTADSRRPARVAEWDGYVTEVGSKTFAGNLLGLFGEGVIGERHEAEIALEDVGPSDLPLLRVGAFFRVCVYSEVDDDDRPKRFAKVVFRRLPAYRDVELDLADRHSDERHRRLRVE